MEIVEGIRSPFPERRRVEDLRSPSPRTRPHLGFVRYECYLVPALLLVVLAVLVPEAHNHGWKGALVALAGIAALLAAGLGVLVGGAWLMERTGRPGSVLGAALRHGLRCLLCAGIAAGLGLALVAQHGLPVAVENGVSLVAGALGGAAGLLLHFRLGPERFWTAFGRLLFALAGSLLFGLFGILGPGNWGVDLGILVPLLIFAIFAACGRVVPPPAEDRRTP
jgi:hypothetical protein